MPQMAPMNWMMIYMYFLMIMMLFIMKIYFSKKNKMNYNLKNSYIKNTTKNWKW
uniref:ATP synthase F0 subunit 8 n=1 Tax=Micadina phluctainoides TaxID=590994 RepID=E2RUY6_MICPD|nr:ATP synthase F0 subunit 8 [Micadina phluctainoides]BAJ24520.1 ATP synthase F0 subunit 8 [Micadina phluctainoides]